MPRVACSICTCLAVLAGLTQHCSATLVSVHTSAAWTDSRIHTCSAGKTSPAGATDLSDCVCQPGRTGVPCEQCPADTFKPGVGDLSCTSCSTNSMSLPGSTRSSECLCAPGFAGSTGPDGCVPCGPGSYKTFTGNSACVACPAHSSCPAQIVPSDSTASSLPQVLASCVCVPGYTQSADGVCVGCEAGKFKSAHGNEACVGCHSNSLSPAAADSDAACLCVAGYAESGPLVCSACDTGTYKTGPGNARDLCVGCLLNTVSPQASTTQTSCVCEAGWYGEAGGPCADCPPTKYCAGVSAQGRMQACPGNSTSPSSSSLKAHCVCDAGYWEGADETCVLCPLNRYCPGDEYNYECPGNSTAVRGSRTQTDCTCVDGFTR